MPETSLFPDLAPAPTDNGRPYPERILTMWRMYGRADGQRCGDCRHSLMHRPGQNRYRKCRLSMITHGPGTDWRAKWPACGRFEPEV